MEKLIFATTNQNKLEEARNILGIEIEGIELPDIEEIQSLDIVKVARYKAISYFTKIKKPLIVEDTSLIFNALNALPGTYINDFSKSLGNSGLLKLLSPYKDRTAKAVTVIAFIESLEHIEIFLGEIEGTISQQEKGTNGFGWDPIFIPTDSDITFGEMNSDQKNLISMRKLALNKLKSFLETV